MYTLDLLPSYQNFEDKTKRKQTAQTDIRSRKQLKIKIKE